MGIRRVWWGNLRKDSAKKSHEILRNARFYEKILRISCEILRISLRASNGKIKNAESNSQNTHPLNPPPQGRGRKNTKSSANE
ncbi:hypothetical protein ACWIUD_08065 [Helicobacter sp. 23-1044]